MIWHLIARILIIFFFSLIPCIQQFEKWGWENPFLKCNMQVQSEVNTVYISYCLNGTQAVFMLLKWHISRIPIQLDGAFGNLKLLSFSGLNR